MTGSREGMLDVPGARLHYRLLGRGPLVLIMQGGDGDADAMDAVAGELAEEFTVLTYDRRGLSRSTLEDPGEVPGIDGHADDAARPTTAHTIRSDDFRKRLGPTIAIIISPSLKVLLGMWPNRVNTFFPAKNPAQFLSLRMQPAAIPLREI